MEEANNMSLQEPEFCEILTERLRLRTVRMADAVKLMPMISCEDVMRWTSQGPVTTISQAERWLHTRAVGPDILNLAVELRDYENSSSERKDIIGLVGSFHPPEVGYMIRPDHAGKGYATEAIQAVIPKLFERMPPLSEGGTGFDHVEGWADTVNQPSRRILEKCGFRLCEIVEDPENSLRGPSQLAIYRKARPGRTLEDLGLVANDNAAADSKAPTPPVQ